jgi:hypothetical protein
VRGPVIDDAHLATFEQSELILYSSQMQPFRFTANATHTTSPNNVYL